MCSDTRIGTRHPTSSQKGLWRVQGEKRTQSLDPCRLGRKYILYCVCCRRKEKKHDPWPSEFEMNMAAWATRLIPFGMQEGYIHHAEEQMCRCGTGIHCYGWSPLGGPSQFKKEI